MEGQDVENDTIHKGIHVSYKNMVSKVRISMHTRESLGNKGNHFQERWGTFRYSFLALCYRCC